MEKIKGQLSIASCQFLNWPIIGHQGIVKFLQKSIMNNKIAHAYLFYGLEHLGKRTVAEYFAQSLITNLSAYTIANLHESITNFTNICDIRGKFVNIRDLQKHPDFYEIKKEEGKKNIGIEQIRKIREKLNLRAFLGEYKVALIDEAQTMTEEASNALLKTLEEPSEKTVIILITTNIGALPRTVVSRCQIVRFLPVAREEMLKSLDNRGILRFAQDDRENNHGILSDGLRRNDYVEPRDDRASSHGILRPPTLRRDPQDDNHVIALSQGRPGIVVNFLENPEGLIKYQEKAQEFVEIMENDLENRWPMVDRIMPKESKFLESQEIFQNLLSIWKSIIRDLLLIKIQQTPAGQEEASWPTRLGTFKINSPGFSPKEEISKFLTNLFLKEKLIEIAEKYSSEQLENILKEIDLTKKYLSWNANPKLAMENLILKL